MNTKVEKALELHDKGYNCAQAVACSFCEEFGVDQETMFKISEGFGFGMGMMDMCGAVTGMMMVIGMDNSIGNLENGKATKADTYKKTKEFAEKFRQKNGTYYCRDLKGVSGKGTDRNVFRECKIKSLNNWELCSHYLFLPDLLRLPHPLIFSSSCNNRLFSTV